MFVVAVLQGAEELKDTGSTVGHGGGSSMVWDGCTDIMESRIIKQAEYKVALEQKEKQVYFSAPQQTLKLRHDSEG